MQLFRDPAGFFRLLEARFLRPLPGENAQNTMTSRARISTQEYLARNPNHRNSAVLMPLFPYRGEIYTALIRRPVYEGMHSGQLALPGGKVEESDASLKQTALRETMEEVGLTLPETAIFGSLTSVYIPPSNFLVHPFVAKLEARPEWVPDAHEVESVLEFPLSQVFDPSVKDRRRIAVGKDFFVEAPCYVLNGEILWGATAMMFAELEAMVLR